MIFVVELFKISAIVNAMKFSGEALHNISLQFSSLTPLSFLLQLNQNNWQLNDWAKITKNVCQSTVNKSFFSTVHEICTVGMNPFFNL